MWSKLVGADRVARCEFARYWGVAADGVVRPVRAGDVLVGGVVVAVVAEATGLAGPGYVALPVSETVAAVVVVAAAAEAILCVSLFVENE